MKIIVYDFSKPGNKRKKIREVLSSLMWRVDDKLYLSDLSTRVISQLLRRIKEMATKSTCIIIMTPNSENFLGWKIEKIGNSKLNNNIKMLGANVQGIGIRGNQREIKGVQRINAIQNEYDKDGELGNK